MRENKLVCIVTMTIFCICALENMGNGVKLNAFFVFFSFHHMKLNACLIHSERCFFLFVVFFFMEWIMIQIILCTYMLYIHGRRYWWDLDGREREIQATEWSSAEQKSHSIVYTYNASAGSWVHGRPCVNGRLNIKYSILRLDYMKLGYELWLRWATHKSMTSDPLK